MINTEHLKNINPFLAMELLARAQKLEKEGRNIIHLELGEPDFPPPEIVSTAAVKAIEKLHTKYTNTQGTEDFRQAVVDKYKRTHNVNFPPEQVLTSCGSSILLYMSMLLLVPPGDEIIITDPCYPCYNNLSLVAGINPVRVKLHLEENFELDVNRVKKAITPKTKAILINSPMNPTGTVISDNSLKELAELEIPIISDEIYADLIYEKKCNSILNYTDNCIILNGLSKYYAMTGWRLGYMIFPKELRAAAARLHQNLMISATHFIQTAGAVAINQAGKECELMKQAFAERKNFLVDKLNQAGLSPNYTPEGAFYLLFRYPDQSRKSMELSLDILEKTGVALTPGVDFGPGGEGFLRFSYANSLKNINEAVLRLHKYFF